MKFMSSAVALFLLLAGGIACAQGPAASAGAPADGLPKQELTPQVLYQFLLAEIAAQRGQFGFSAGAYLDLAKNTRDPRVVRRAVEIAFHARQYEAALEGARLWLEIEPQSPQARQMLSTLLLASGRIEELSGSLARDLAADAPRAGEALLRFMRAFVRYPDKSAIQRLFDQLTQPYLGLPEARFVRAQAAIGAGNPDRARAEIDQALELRPGWDLAAMLKAELLPKGAAQLDFLQAWLGANPDAREVRLGYARALVADKRYDAARTEFSRLLASNPDNPEILFAVGILSLQLDDTAAAERHLRRYVEIGRGDLGSARFYLAQIADQANRVDEALQLYGLVSAGEHLVPARLRAVRLLLRQNRFDEARQQLATARAGSPDDMRLVVAEAQLLRDAGRHEEAFAFLAAALEGRPDQPDFLYETALAAERLGQFDVLERHLRRLIAIKPDSAQAYNALGYSLADRNLRLDEAAQFIDKALALAPDDPYILDSKGWLQFRQGKLAAALETLRKAFAQKPEAEIAAHLGEVLWALGRSDEARGIWREASKAHPTNETLAATIKRFMP